MTKSNIRCILFYMCSTAIVTISCLTSYALRPHPSSRLKSGDRVRHKLTKDNGVVVSINPDGVSGYVIWIPNSGCWLLPDGPQVDKPDSMLAQWEPR